MSTEPPEKAPPTADDQAGTTHSGALERATARVPATESDSEAADFEGPRRRARREREERRQVQQRARAIETARIQAKQEARGKEAPEAATLPKGTVRGLKALAWSVVVIVLAAVLGVVLYFTPVMAARSIVVAGTAAVPQEEILAAAGVRAGTPLLQIDTDAVARRVAEIRRVATVRVQRQYPSTLRITVVERVAIVVKDYADGTHLFDKDGVDFAVVSPTQPRPPEGPSPTSLPYLDVENPGPADPPTLAALQVLTSLRPEVSAQMARIAAPSVASITLTLIDGRVVIWGDTERTEEKADKLAALLTQPGRTYDVSTPDLPTIK